MIINIPKMEEWEEVNKIAKQVHEMHVKWRPDIFKSVEDVIEKSRFEDLINNKEIYVIRQDNNIIGYITFCIKQKDIHGMQHRKILHIDSIAVDKDYRGKGSGTQLIKHVIDLGKKQNCTDLSLSVNEENVDAIKLYEKLGMRVKGISYSMKIKEEK